MSDTNEHQDNNSQADRAETRQRVIHGLLSAVGERGGGELDHRVNAAIDAINVSIRDEDRGTSRRRWTRIFAGAIAATLLLGAFLFPPSQSVSAIERVEWLREVAVELSDRRYAMNVEFRSPQRQGQLSLVGDLYVRGNEALLQKIETDNGVQITLGRVAGTVWVMGRRGPVRIVNAKDDKKEGPPMLSLPAMLETVTEGYDLREEATDDPGVRRLIAERNAETLAESDDGAAAESNKKAETMSFEFDSTSGITRTAEMRWTAPSRMKFMRIVFVEKLELPADWYQHDSHHGPMRRVVDFSN